eukprot:140807-Prymnesium_polylepis.2
MPRVCTQEGRCPIRTGRHVSPDQLVGHRSSTHVTCKHGWIDGHRDGLTRTAPAYAQAKESRR